jgi:hypothetical protein
LQLQQLALEFATGGSSQGQFRQPPVFFCLATYPFRSIPHPSGRRPRAPALVDFLFEMLCAIGAQNASIKPISALKTLPNAPKSCKISEIDSQANFFYDF